MTQHQKLVGDEYLASASALRLNGILVNINFESMWIALSFPGPELSMPLSKFKFLLSSFRGVSQHFKLLCYHCPSDPLLEPLKRSLTFMLIS